MAQPQKAFNTIAANIPGEEWFTIDQVADSMGLGKLRAKQILDEAVERKITQKITKKNGVRVFYAEQMVDKVLTEYKNGAFGKPRSRAVQIERNLKNAELILEVPVFDSKMADVLNNMFGSKEKIVEFLKDKLSEVFSPAAAELQQMEREFEERKRKLMAGMAKRQ